MIPLAFRLLEQALHTDNCQQVLDELEEPYIVRSDPYLESKPIRDPNWFFGRGKLLQDLPVALAQGQHVCLLGLRKVGKTSLLNQICQRIAKRPLVYIDCQELTADASHFYETILKELEKWLRNSDLNVPPTTDVEWDASTFRRRFNSLYGCWRDAGHTDRVVIVFDEIDKLLPNEELRGYEAILGEYVSLFKTLRGLAQSQQNLVTLVAAYRADINRRNHLSDSVGENPMFRSFKEVHIGFLRAAESKSLIKDIGLWKGIKWNDAAADTVFDYCAGHPLLTRYFASLVSKEGTLMQISLNRVEKVARECVKEFRRNDIGNYYKEAVWGLLYPSEQESLLAVRRAGSDGMREGDITSDMEDAITNLENFGLIVKQSDHLTVTSDLLNSWLARRADGVARKPV